MATIEFSEVRRDGDGTYWRVELYDESKTFPVAYAYCVVMGGSHCQLNFICVADQWRGRGHGKVIVEAIKSRWPNFHRTGPMDERGEGLQQSTMGEEERLQRWEEEQ